MAMYHGDIITNHGSRYLQQLCKHWGHKFIVEFDPYHGSIQLGAVRCTLQAEPDRLLVDLDGEDPGELPRLCDVVFEHIQRFAFRETLATQWVQGARPSS